MAGIFWIIKHARKDLRFIEIFFIMHPQIVGAHSFAYLYNHRFKAIEFNALVLLCAEYQWLAMLQKQRFFGFELFSVNTSKAPSLKILQF